MAEAGRVIAGSAGGLRLVAPGSTTRPLADRVKQTLFAILEADLPGARFLDLFAGSGAAGIEALSRGAATAVFVERDPTAVRVIAENLLRTGLAGEGARVVRADALAYLRGQASTDGPFELAMVDPPYADPASLVAALELLGDPDRHMVVPGGRVVAKHFWRSVPPPAAGLLASERQRRFGETSLTFYRHSRPAGGREQEMEA